MLKRILLLSLAAIHLPAALMPPAKQSMVSLEGLPTELKREILLQLIQYGPALNVDALAKDILRLAAINKNWRANINNLPNILTILNALPRPAAIHLIEKLAQLPVIQENMLKILQTLSRSGAKYLGKVLAGTPGMENNAVKKWLNSFELVDGQELIEAVSMVNLDMAHVNTLLANPNIAVNAQDGAGRTPLLLASSIGRTEIVKKLLAAGANVNMKQKIGNTALMVASQNEHIEIVKALLAAGADIDTKDTFGVTALISASAYGHIEIVKALLASGANVNMQNKKGYTALIEASMRGFTEIVKALLDSGADVTMQNQVGDTALKSACDLARYNLHRASDYTETIKLLEDAEKAQKEKAARK